MIFRQLFDQTTSTLTYLLGDESTKEAILIDSVFEQHLRDVALVRELGLRLVWTLDTHVHADHITGAWLLREALGSQIGLSLAAGASGADRELSDGDVISCGDIRLQARSTPGHTGGCLTYVNDQQKMAFTGDALLIRGAGRTDFQGGSAEQLFHSVRQQIFSLPDDYLLYPAHDYHGRTVTTVFEEKQFNPRLGEHIRESDFVAYMKNLGLPHPKKIDEAVPANLKCGRPDPADQAATSPAWGPVVRTFAGVWQVEPEWVFSHRGELTLLDVREKTELENDFLGQMEGIVHVPLSSLREAVDSVPQDRPVITVCPSGARSAIAAQVLERAGHQRVANLVGGLMAWRDLGYPLSDRG